MLAGQLPAVKAALAARRPGSLVPREGHPDSGTVVASRADLLVNPGLARREPRSRDGCARAGEAYDDEKGRAGRHPGNIGTPRLSAPVERQRVRAGHEPLSSFPGRQPLQMQVGDVARSVSSRGNFRVTHQHSAGRSCAGRASAHSFGPPQSGHRAALGGASLTPRGVPAGSAAPRSRRRERSRRPKRRTHIGPAGSPPLRGSRRAHRSDPPPVRVLRAKRRSPRCA